MNINDKLCSKGYWLFASYSLSFESGSTGDLSSHYEAAWSQIASKLWAVSSVSLRQSFSTTEKSGFPKLGFLTIVSEVTKFESRKGWQMNYNELGPVWVLKRSVQWQRGQVE